MTMSKIEVRLNPDVQPTGSDLAVINAARRSFNTRSEWENEEDSHRLNWEPELKEKDKRLLQFLARGMTADDFERFIDNTIDECRWLHETLYGDGDPSEQLHFQKQLAESLWQWRNTPTHDTPFNHCFISFEVKAPIFVRAQLVKHEYLIMSEFSRRYITEDVEFYEPDYWRKAAKDKKQGSLEEEVEKVWFGDYGENYQAPIGFITSAKAEHDRMLFKSLIDGGVAPEQARMVLPQSTMTEWTHSGTLGAFAKLCRLRLHKDTQYECRLVAEVIYKHLLEHYPISSKALVEGPDI